MNQDYFGTERIKINNRKPKIIDKLLQSSIKKTKKNKLYDLQRETCIKQNKRRREKLNSIQSFTKVFSQQKNVQQKKFKLDQHSKDKYLFVSKQEKEAQNSRQKLDILHNSKIHYKNLQIINPIGRKEKQTNTKNYKQCKQSKFLKVSNYMDVTFQLESTGADDSKDSVNNIQTEGPVLQSEDHSNFLDYGVKLSKQQVTQTSFRKTMLQRTLKQKQNIYRHYIRSSSRQTGQQRQKTKSKMKKLLDQIYELKESIK